MIHFDRIEVVNILNAKEGIQLVMFIFKCYFRTKRLIMYLKGRNFLGFAKIREIKFPRNLRKLSTRLNSCEIKKN